MGDSDLSTYSKTPRNTVNRYRTRGAYDYITIHNIVNSVPVLHVSFPSPDPDDPFPAMLPMLGFMGSFAHSSANLADPLELYLHGYISSRLMRLGETSQSGGEGLPLTIAATHLDGVVLALTPNNHSYNYRSAVLHGFAVPVTDADEKLWAMEKITNSVVSDRWANCRVPPTKTEMTSTQILKVSIVDASAKVRKGIPHDDRADMRNEELRDKTWVGVIPSWTTYGEAIASPDNLAKQVPDHVTTFVRKENEIRKKVAMEAAVE